MANDDSKYLSIYYNRKAKQPWTKFVAFVQKMSNRLSQGYFRYGVPDAGYGYMSRLHIELDAYRSNGNTEHLYNLCVYAFLEYVAPEHYNAHEDNTVPSATRKGI